MRKFLNKTIILVSLLILFSSSPAWSTDEDLIQTEGILMEVDLKTNTMVVNERRFSWDSNTFITNEKGSSITIDKLKTNSLIYMESIEDRANKRILVKKIRLIKKLK